MVRARKKIAKGLSSLLPVNRNEWQTVFCNDRKGPAELRAMKLYQNRNVIPTWLG
jgi:hypothetical protein